MVHHHVAVGARLFVEADALTDRKRLRHVDLHVRDVLPIPDGLEQAVREAEGEDVERRLLAEEVVDAEDLALVEGLVQRVVELHRAREIGAERLLHDDAGARREPHLAELLHDFRRGGGRNTQIVEPADISAELVFELTRRSWRALRCPRSGTRRTRATRSRTSRRRERRDARTLRARRGERAEGVVVEVVERSTDDPELGQQARLREMEEAGQQLAPRQVARRAEEHHHLRAQGRREQARVDVGRIRHVCDPLVRVCRPCAAPVSRGLRRNDGYMNVGNLIGSCLGETERMTLRCPDGP